MIYAETATLVETRAAVRAQMETAVPGRPRVLRRGGRRAVHVPAVPARAVAGAANDERAGADQRRVPAAHQDASEPPEPGRRVVVAVRAAAQRADSVAAIDGWQEMRAVKEAA